MPENARPVRPNLLNPLAWYREHQLAGLAFCGAGALCGLIWAWIDSPFYRICHSPGGFADCGHMLELWLTYPSQYWVMTLVGAMVPGLLFAGFLLAGVLPAPPAE